MKKRLWSIALLAGLPMLAAAADRPDEWEALYQKRFATLMQAGGVFTAYDPMEAVSGTKSWKPMPVVVPAARSIRQDALAEATDYARRNASRAFLVWRDGKMQTAAFFGETRPETPLVSRSLSKPLTAIAVGRAIALGKITSLDQPIADFIPEWIGTPKSAILIRHLLDQRSGLLEQMISSDPDHPVNRVYIDPDHGKWLIHDYPLTHRPGTHYGYNNATSELVALVIERATGQRYASFIGQEVLKPIGAPGGEIWVNRPDGLAHSGCCMRLPAESWLRMGILLLDDGVVKGRRLLPRGYVATMRQGTQENPHYGLGVWVAGPYVERRGFGGASRPGPKVLHSAPYADRDLFMFDGNANQLVYISPATRTVILRLGDAPPRTPEWDNSVLPNLILRGAVMRKKDKPLQPQI